MTEVKTTAKCTPYFAAVCEKANATKAAECMCQCNGENHGSNKPKPQEYGNNKLESEVQK